MTISELKKLLLDFQGISLSTPKQANLEVYILNGDDNKMFALVNTSKLPLRLSLRCNPGLSALLREKYESVMAGEKLDPRNWNTIILSGQLTDDEIHDLIRHSYELTKQISSSVI